MAEKSADIFAFARKFENLVGKVEKFEKIIEDDETRKNKEIKLFYQIEQKFGKMEQKFDTLKDYIVSSVQWKSQNSKMEDEQSDKAEIERLKAKVSALSKLVRDKEEVIDQLTNQSASMEEQSRVQRLNNCELLDKFKELLALTKETLVQVEELVRERDALKEERERKESAEVALSMENEELKRSVSEKRLELKQFRNRMREREEVERKMERVLEENEEHKRRIKMADDKYEEREIEHRLEISKLSEAKVELGQSVDELEVKLSQLEDMVVARYNQRQQDYCGSLELPVGQPDYSWLIFGERSDEHLHWNEFHSAEFELRGYNSHSRLFAQATGSVVNIRLLFVGPLNEHILPRLTLVLRDKYNFRSMDKRMSFVLPFNLQRYKTINYSYSRSFFVENLETGSSSFYVDYKNRIRVEVFVEEPEVASKFVSNDGLLLWKVNGFEEKRQLALKQLVDGELSPYFYTGSRGHRVQVKLHLEVKGRCFLTVLFLTGSHDRFLDGTSVYEVSVTLVNPDDPEVKWVKTKVHTLDGLNTYFFMSIGHVEHVQRYVTRDALHIRVQIVKK